MSFNSIISIHYTNKHLFYKDIIFSPIIVHFFFFSFLLIFFLFAIIIPFTNTKENTYVETITNRYIIRCFYIFNSWYIFHFVAECCCFFCFFQTGNFSLCAFAVAWQIQ